MHSRERRCHPFEDAPPPNRSGIHAIRLAAAGSCAIIRLCISCNVAVDSSLAGEGTALILSKYSSMELNCVSTSLTASRLNSPPDGRNMSSETPGRLSRHRPGSGG